jgi:hypothetical protein
MLASWIDIDVLDDMMDKDKINHWDYFVNICLPRDICHNDQVEDYEWDIQQESHAIDKSIDKCYHRNSKDECHFSDRSDGIW